MITFKKSFSLLLLASMLASSVNAGNTLFNILNHSNIGMPILTGLSFAGYRAGLGSDLTSTSASSIAMAAMQAKAEYVKGTELTKAAVEVVKEGVKPWIGHVTAQYGLPAVVAGLRYLGASESVIPDVRVSPKVANLVILTYVATMKATGQLSEK